MFKSLDTSIAHIYYLESNFRPRFRFYSEPVQINCGNHKREAFKVAERFGKKYLCICIYQTVKIAVAQLRLLLVLLGFFFCERYTFV